MIKKYESASVSKIAKNLSKYIALAEAGNTIYVIKNSMIVAQITKADYRGEIQ